jgi:hypothetical protein
MEVGAYVCHQAIEPPRDCTTGVQSTSGLDTGYHLDYYFVLSIDEKSRTSMLYMAAAIKPERTIATIFTEFWVTIVVHASCT